jgi:hypothetical protein
MTTKLRSQMVLQPETWYGARVTFNGTTAQLYIDDVAVPTAPVITPFEWAAPNLRFAGDEVTFGQIQLLTQGNLLACYKCDESFGAMAADSSGHENDAALIGSWEWVPAELPHLDWAHSGNTLVLSWPSGSGLVLQSTDSLSSPNWVQVTDLTAQVVGGKNTVTTNTATGTRFFRLAGM